MKAMDHERHRLSFWALCIALIIVTLLFGWRVKYNDTVYWSLAALQFVWIVVAAWNLGGMASIVNAHRRRELAVAGGLLIAPWALFSFLPGIGPPGDQTAAENELRYLILLISAVAIGIGFVVLSDMLANASERFFSTLGSATILIATPLYLVWATIAVGYFRAKGDAGPAQVPAAMLTLAELSEILLFFAGALTYVATAVFAISLGQSGWLGRRTSSVLTALSIVALVFLVIRGLWFPNPKVVFTHWYAIPGYIVGIPAVPWFIPLLIGVALLRRAGADSD